MRVSSLLLAASALAASPAAAQSNIEAVLPDTGESAQGEVSLTIYNNDLALVQDIRQLSFPAGRSRQEFPDVSARIQAQTVSFAAPGTGIVEQNFDYDLLTPQKLMAKAVGQEVTIVRTNPATGGELRERATILSTNAGVVMRIGDRIEVLRDDGIPTRVIFDRVPPNLRARPTLSVTVESEQSGPRPTRISYLTPGLGWKADYVTLFDEEAGKIDVTGWITLSNNTGTTFHNAEVLMVAGSPAIGTDSNGRGRPQRSRIVPGTESGTRGRLGDFYLYPLTDRTTVASAQTKQVSFLDVQGASAEKRYEYDVRWGQDDDDDPGNARSVIKFSSGSQQGLGDQLPMGTVRVYMKDAQGQPQFVGQNNIGHTPMGSTISLTTGEAFDVRVEARPTKRERISTGEWEKSARYRITEGEEVRIVQVDREPVFWQTTMQYTVYNSRPIPVVVDVTQRGLSGRYRDTRIISESMAGEQVSLDRRIYRVPVAANSETVVTVTYQSRY